MALENVSMYQALQIWSELEQAYYSDNKYGGDTAEIYAYRLMPNMPGEQFTKSLMMQQAVIEQQVLAGKDLARLCELFACTRSCQVLIDGLSPYEWSKGQPFDHRAHVQVIV